MKNVLRQIPVALTVALLLAASTANATDHNSGFFLRLAGGGSTNSTSITDPASSSKFELSGIGGNLSAAIGAVVKPNFALHGTVWGWLVSSPDVTLDGAAAGQYSSNLNMSAFGGGATYYFMPANFYVTSSAGVGRLSTDGGSSDAGFVLDFAVGKEWWVSSAWGMGLNAGINYHSVPDGGVSANWSGTTFVINLSATCN